MDKRDGLSQTQTAEGLCGEPERPLCLKVISCPCNGGVGAQIPLVPGELVVGRCDEGKEASFRPGQVLIPDSRISRRHARFSVVGATVAVHDLGSKNGTFVGGAKVEAALVSHQQVVRLGDTLLLCCIPCWPLVRQAAGGDGMLGESAVLQEVRRTVARFGPTGLSVLISGESGTGKELVARAFHEASGRKGPFVAVNSSAIPRDLAESELFGVKKGAFSGADRDRRGLVQQANGGTLFLDEIGDMPMALQAKLLRVVEQQEVTPLGTTTAEKIDVRFLAATNRDVIGAAERGEFRLDLLHRMSQSTIQVPPLRERREDILGLWCAFLGDRGGHAYPSDANLAEALLLYPWPGNVRELRNVAAECKVKLAAAGQSSVGDLPTRIKDFLVKARAGEPPADLNVAVHQPQVSCGGSAGAPPIASAGGLQQRERPGKEALLDSLRRHRGNLAAVAAEFGRQRPQAYRWLAHYGIDPAPFREEEPS